MTGPTAAERVVNEFVTLVDGINDGGHLRTIVVFVGGGLFCRIDRAGEPVGKIVTKRRYSAGLIGSRQQITRRIVGKVLFQPACSSSGFGILDLCKPIEFVITIIRRAAECVSDARQIRHQVILVTRDLIVGICFAGQTVSRVIGEVSLITAGVFHLCSTTGQIVVLLSASLAVSRFPCVDVGPDAVHLVSARKHLSQ
jgi:hypothetical protein